MELKYTVAEIALLVSEAELRGFNKAVEIMNSVNAQIEV